MAIGTSVQSLSRVQLFVTPWTTAHQASLSITNSRVHPNPCPLSWWCHPTILSSVFPFSPWPQSFPASGSFQRSQLFTSGGQSIGVSASASILPMNIQDWFPLRWTGWISLQSKGLSCINNYLKCKLIKYPTKRHRLAEWIQKKTHIYIVYKKPTSVLKKLTGWKWMNGKIYLIKWKAKESWSINSQIIQNRP